MKYPRKIMSANALVKECGFTRTYIENAIAAPDQTFAEKTNVYKSSRYQIDTEEFEKWRQKHIAMQKKARRQRVGINPATGYRFRRVTQIRLNRRI